MVADNALVSDNTLFTYTLIPLIVTMSMLVMMNFFAYLFIKSGYPKAVKQTLGYRTVASTLMLAFGVYIMIFLNSNYGGIYERHIMTGLLLCWLGDFCWSMDPLLEGQPRKIKDIPYAIGGILYGSGYMLYVVAFLKAAVRIYGWWLDQWYFITLFLVMLGLIVMKEMNEIHLVKKPVGISIFALVIGLLVVSGGTLAAHMNEFSAASLCILAGPLLLLLSNGLICAKYLEPERFDTMLIRAFYVMAYYVGQVLICISMAFVAL